ncbi:MAG: succinate dehydrogenase, cytochrome b556 subunit [Acidisphaera sp.]|nr:succinate dehydrogenase, cytochrome b556 subunit [Acidisphaera sp.]
MPDVRDALMVAKNTEGRLVRRPLSPFMLGSAYRFQLTSSLSILNRITGVAVSVGTIVLTWWLVAAATSPAAYDTVSGFLRSWIGLLLLFGWSASLFYHLLNGIRHLAWDGGIGFDLPEVHRSGWAVVIGTVVLTVLVWAIGLTVL